MAKRVKLNLKGFYDLRRAPKVREDLERRAKAIADEANSRSEGGYEVGSRQGQKKPQGRWRASVVTADGKAVRDNARNNTLLRSLDAGRR